jgi:DUF1680 family protein
MTRPALGPIAPTAGSPTVLWPVPARIEDGFWAVRQRLANEVGLPHGVRMLRVHGLIDHLRRAASRQVGADPGRPYRDSDVYKLAEAIAWDPAGDDGTTLRDLATLIGEAQEPSGYLNSWYQCTGTPHFSDLQLGHELYCAGHLIQAAIASVRARGDTALLGPAIAFADHLVATFLVAGPVAGTVEEPARICGHPEIETALVELYRLTGQGSYLALARQMIDERGHGTLGAGRRGAAYYQDETPIRAASELDGHCVRAMYLAAGAADVYLETGEEALLAALARQWAHTVATKTYLTGGVGCRRKNEAFGAPYELPPDHAFNETCAGVANLMWSWRMLLATGDGRYADHIERVLYNVLAAGMSSSGDHFSYVNTLHRRSSTMEHGDKAPYRRPWFGCPCCPPNLMRILTSLGHYLATMDDEGVQIHQYATGTVQTPALTLTVHTGYPWSGDIDVHVTAVTPANESEQVVALRLPAWCQDWQVRVNGALVDAERSERGYLTLRRPWHPGDQIAVHLAMPPRFTWSDRRIDATRGCVAIERGPLVYCVEEADLPGVDLDDLAVDTDAALGTTARPDLLGGVVTIQAAARTLTHHGPAWPYGDPATTAAADELTVTAIPYYAWDNRGRGTMRTWLMEAGVPARSVVPV